MQWGWSSSEQTAMAIMDYFVESGGNFIDTADIYSNWVPGNPGGVAEEIIGRWMKSRGNRSQIVLATKVGGRTRPGPDGAGLGKCHVKEAIEASLRRLQTDYVDLYQAHTVDASTPIEQTLGTFTDLVRDGSIRFVGASNYPMVRLVEALSKSHSPGLVAYASLQPRYNLAERKEFEQQLKPICERVGLGVIPYSPLAGGFLTGKYTRDGPKPASVRAEEIATRLGGGDWGWQVLERARTVGRRDGKTVSQVALAWLLSQEVITAPIVGANTIAQLQESLGGLDYRLTAEAMDILSDSPGSASPGNS